MWLNILIAYCKTLTYPSHFLNLFLTNFHFWILISIKLYKHLTLMYNAIDQPRLECVFIKGKVYKNWSFFLFIWCGPPTEGNSDFFYYGKPLKWQKNIHLQVGIFMSKLRHKHCKRESNWQILSISKRTNICFQYSFAISNFAKIGEIPLGWQQICLSGKPMGVTLLVLANAQMPLNILACLHYYTRTRDLNWKCFLN